MFPKRTGHCEASCQPNLKKNICEIASTRNEEENETKRSLLTQTVLKWWPVEVRILKMKFENHIYKKNELKTEYYEGLSESHFRKFLRFSISLKR